jgi:Ser/Thr protein kinase RdoA (MazF antagonist)
VTAGGERGKYAVDDTRLRRIVEKLLGDYLGHPQEIAHFKRTPLDFSSSFAIEELEFTLEGGADWSILFKNLSQRALTMEARVSRPGFLFNPRREIDVYGSLLPLFPLDTATCVGSVIDEQNERYWLFLERVAGVELYQLGDFDIWLEAARWLARFHDSAASLAKVPDSFPSLLRYDRAFYRAWPRRAKSYLQSGPAAGRDQLEWMGRSYERVIDRLQELPRTVLHGDFNASNILVRESGESNRICPIDWEMAALGPGFIDLAALISGSWNEEQRRALVSAYLGVLRDSRLGPEEFERALVDVKCCQLHLALQWLGWSPDWSPPREHRQDWLGQAMDLAGQLGL